MEVLSFALLLLLVLGVYWLVCNWKNKKSEKFSGYGTISALNFYNRQRHCWKDDEGTVYCSTDSKLQL
jgi:hypothetical protein